MIVQFEQTQNLSSAGHLWINKRILAYRFAQFERAAVYA